MRRSRTGLRLRRGQATVELALSTILFVVIIAGGIHFAELGMIGVKATEAASAALWDATGRLPHAYGDDKLQPRFADVATAATERIDAQYRNYDGRTSQTGGAPTLVFTRAGELRVTCEVIDGAVIPAMEMHDVNNVYFENDAHRGIRCRTSATASIIPGSTPQSFHEDAGWLRGPILKNSEIEFCGVGRAWGGVCNPGTPMLIGEWGLMDPNSGEAGECPVQADGDCANSGYYNAVNQYYDSPAGVPKGEFGSILASTVAMRPSPVDEDKFWMSFRGSESDFTDQVPGTFLGERAEFSTSPGGPKYQNMDQYREMYLNVRSDCWLGLPCELP